MEIFEKYKQLITDIKLAEAIVESNIEDAPFNVRPGLQGLKVEKRREVLSKKKELRDLVASSILYLEAKTPDNEVFNEIAVKDMDTILIDLDQLYLDLAARLDNIGKTFSSTHFSILREQLETIFDGYAERYNTGGFLPGPATDLLGFEVSSFESLFDVVKKTIETGVVRQGLPASALAKMYAEDKIVEHALKVNYPIENIGILPVIVETIHLVVSRLA